MRAVLLASAPATTSGGRRRRSPITHGSALVAFERSKLALAPLIRSRRKYWLPRLDIPPRRCLPPVEFCRGTRPSQAANSRPLRKPLGSTTVAARAVAMPGTLARRWLTGLLLCQAMSCFSISIPSGPQQIACPVHEPADALIELKRNMGPIAFSAQYQQSPIPPGGTIIQRKWLTTYDDIQPQSADRIIMSWDIALSETESGDYSACVVLLRRGEVFYVLEVVRGQFPFDLLKQKVMEVKRRYDSPTLLIEDSPISRGLIQSLREKSINVTVYKPDTDKRARVIAQSDL